MITEEEVKEYFRKRLMEEVEDDCVQTIREESKGDKIELLDYSGTLIFSIPYDAFSTIEII